MKMFLKVVAENELSEVSISGTSFSPNHIPCLRSMLERSEIPTCVRSKAPRQGKFPKEISQVFLHLWQFLPTKTQFILRLFPFPWRKILHFPHSPFRCPERIRTYLSVYSFITTIHCYNTIHTIHYYYFIIKISPSWSESICFNVLCLHAVFTEFTFMKAYTFKPGVWPTYRLISLMQIQIHIINTCMKVLKTFTCMKVWKPTWNWQEFRGNSSAQSQAAKTNPFNIK